MRALSVIAALALFALLPAAASAAERTPVVLFPGYTLNKVRVTVNDQVAAPDCPRSGTFDDWFGNDAPSTTFSQVCRDKLMTLRYDADPSKPMARRFSEQRGVSVRIADYGKTGARRSTSRSTGARGGRLHTRPEHPRGRLRRRGSRRTWTASSGARSA